MSLCRELGGMTYTEFLARVSSREIAMWRAYNELEKEDDDAREATRKAKAEVRR